MIDFKLFFWLRVEHLKTSWWTLLVSGLRQLTTQLSVRHNKLALHCIALHCIVKQKYYSESNWNYQ